MKHVQNPSTDSSVKGLTSMHRIMCVVCAMNPSPWQRATTTHTKHQATCTPQTCAFTEVTAKTLKESTRSHLQMAVTTLQRRPKNHKPISELCKQTDKNVPTSVSQTLARSARKHDNSVRDQHFSRDSKIRAVIDQEQPSSTTRCTCVGEG